MKFPLVMAAALAVAAAGAVAQTAAKPRAERAFGTGKGPLLTRNELRACLERQDKLRVETDALAKERAAREAEKDALKASGEALKAELETLDRTSVEAVEQYNAKASARDQAVDAFQAGAAAYNERAQALAAQRQAFAQACENRRYDEDDELAIRKGR